MEPDEGSIKDEGVEDEPIVGKVFSQDEMSRIATREKEQGKRSGQREVLDSLGFKSLEDAQSFTKTLQDAESAKLSEADRTKKEAEAERDAAKRERLEAKQERFQARLERQLLTAGVAEAQVAKVTKLVESDVDSSDEEITASIAELKESMPQLFTPAQQDTKPPDSDPGKPSNKKVEPDPKKRAQDRLQSRHGERLKSNS